MNPFFVFLIFVEKLARGRSLARAVKSTPLGLFVLLALMRMACSPGRADHPPAPPPPSRAETPATPSDSSPKRAAADVPQSPVSTSLDRRDTVNAATLRGGETPHATSEPTPRFFPLEDVVPLPGNPEYSPAMVADLVESLRQHGQRVPAFVAPSPELPEGKFYLIDGNRRRAALAIAGLPRLWAFNLGRDIAEADRIRLLFEFNHTRRVMRLDEVAEQAARFQELTSCTAAEAATHLNISPAKLSRAYGERRIPPELRERADRLFPSIRWIIASLRPELMAEAIAFAETPGEDGRKRTRDEVSSFVQGLKLRGRGKALKPKTLTLRLSNRTLTFTLAAGDTAQSVSDDLKAVIATLGKHAHVSPDGWPFLFR